jgi:hypothetical protein
MNPAGGHLTGDVDLDLMLDQIGHAAAAHRQDESLAQGRGRCCETKRKNEYSDHHYSPSFLFQRFSTEQYPRQDKIFPPRAVFFAAGIERDAEL